MSIDKTGNYEIWATRGGNAFLLEAAHEELNSAIKYAEKLKKELGIQTLIANVSGLSDCNADLANKHACWWSWKS